MSDDRPAPAPAPTPAPTSTPSAGHASGAAGGGSGAAGPGGMSVDEWRRNIGMNRARPTPPPDPTNTVTASQTTTTTSSVTPSRLSAPTSTPEPPRPDQPVEAPGSTQMAGDLFTVLSGFFWGSGVSETDVPQRKALQYVVLAAPEFAPIADQLDDRDGDATCHLKINAWEKTAEVTTKRLRFKRFRSEALGCAWTSLELNDVNIHTSIAVGEYWQKGGEALLSGVTIGFSALQLRQFKQGGMPPINADARGFQVAAHADSLIGEIKGLFSAGTPDEKEAEAPVDIDSYGRMPEGTRVDVRIENPITAGEKDELGSIKGNSGFDKFHLVVYDKDDAELAALVVGKARASGGGSNLAGSVEYFTARGAPEIVKILLESSVVRSNPIVAYLIDLIRNSGIEPAAGGSITLTNIDLAQFTVPRDYNKAGPHSEIDGTAGGVNDLDCRNSRVEGGGNLHVNAVVPNVGSFEVWLDGFHMEFDVDGAPSQTIDESGPFGRFNSFRAKLSDKDGTEKSYLEVSGANIGANTANVINKFIIRGDVGALFDAGVENLKLPEPVRVAFSTISKLGLGNIKGEGSIGLENFKLDKTADGYSAQGNFNADFSLDGTGRIMLSVRGLSAPIGGNLQVAFDAFEATLENVKGQKAAHIVVACAPGETFVKSEASKKDPKTSNLHLRARSVKVDGSGQDIATLFQGLEQYMSKLPPQVKIVVDAVEKYGERIPAKGGIEMQNASVDVVDGATTVKGDISAHVDVPGTGSVEALLRGARYGQTSGFDLLRFKLLKAGGNVAAELNVKGVRNVVVGGKKGSSGDIGSVEFSGDGTQLKTLLLDPKFRELLPAQISESLALLDGQALTTSMENVKLSESATGGISARTGAIELESAFHFVDQTGGQFMSPRAHLTVRDAHAEFWSSTKMPKLIEGSAMSAEGKFVSLGDRRIEGEAKVSSGHVRISLDEKGAPTSVLADNLTGDGNIGIGPSKAAPPRQVSDGGAGRVHDIVKVVREADVHINVPLHAGRYGHGKVGLEVPTGAMAKVDLLVRARNLAAGTGITFQPVLGIDGWADWASIKGISLEVDGPDKGKLKTDLNWIPKDFNIAEYLVDGDMQLNLAGLIRDIMTKQNNQDPASAAQDSAADAKWLKEEKAKWERSSKRDEEDRPRSASIGGLVTQGIDYMAASGTAHLGIETKNAAGEVDIINLRGTAEKGGSILLGADKVHMTDKNNSVRIENASVHGTFEPGSTDKITIHSFALDQVVWSDKSASGAAKDEVSDVRKPDK